MPERDEHAGERAQDPRVDRLRPDPMQPPVRGRTLNGFWAASDRAGRGRLYVSRDLRTYVEFSLDDVLSTADVPADRGPFLGEDSTEVVLAPEAEFELIRSRRVPIVDDFDLDVRFGSGAARARVGVYASSVGDECMKVGEHITDPCDYSCDWLCETMIYPHGGGCDGGGGNGGGPDPGTDTCHTCVGATQCGTCHTEYGATHCGTCHTDVGATACGTCDTDWAHTNCGGCDRGVVRR